jgi:anti-sigma28 factor (negative regulator of flagellin synthesis)
MRINDQGFTERLSSSANRADETKAAGSTSSSSTSKLSGGSSSDNLQLSNIASHLQSLGGNDSDRAARVSQIAKAVGNNTYQISAAKISQALVSEAVQSAAA